MKILVAPDSFKESLSAADVAKAIAEGLSESISDVDIRCLPLADGGEGTVEALTSAMGGSLETVDVKDPLGRCIQSQWGKIDNLAIIEMAAASGLELLSANERNPLITDSFGTGQVILEAIRQGANKIILGLGGSATNDGGAGLLRALGVRLLNEQGQDIGPGGGALNELHQIDFSNLHPKVKDIEFAIACDVTNPLCGDNGASAIFGPQKGANDNMVEQLDNNLRHFASLLQSRCDIDLLKEPGMGAAGGLSLGLEAVAKTKRSSGFSLISSTTGLKEHLQWADLVITGEGKTDHQSLAGKTCFGVAEQAQQQQTPCIIISGALGAGYEQLYQHGVTACFSAAPGPVTLEDAMQNAYGYLQHTARSIGRMLTIKP